MIGQTTWKELISQPETWQRLLERLDADRDVPALDMELVDEILVVGSGTSYYLALAVTDWIGRRHSVTVQAIPSCEVVLDADRVRLSSGRRRLVIAISRSGESSELILAIAVLKQDGVSILGVSCCAGSSLLQTADHKFLIAEGYENGLIMLRSFTAMLLALQYVFGSVDDRAALRTLPSAGRALLDAYTDSLCALANRRSFDRFVYLASGPNYPIAVEASLKAQEMSISTSEAYHSLEYRHGPMATATSETLVALFCLPDTNLGLSLARDLDNLGATVLTVGSVAERYDQIATLAICTPTGLNDGQASVLYLLPLQVMAFATALRKGNNPDAPKNLSKVVILAASPG